MDAYITQVQLNTKFITEYFNGPYYAKNHKFEYLVKYRIETDIQPNMTYFKKYSVVQNQVSFFKEKFIDLSSFSLFNFAEELEYYIVSFDGNGIRNNVYTKKSAGLFYIELVQSAQQNNEQWSIYSFDLILA